MDRHPDILLCASHNAQRGNGQYRTYGRLVIGTSPQHRAFTELLCRMLLTAEFQEPFESRLDFARARPDPRIFRVTAGLLGGRCPLECRGARDGGASNLRASKRLGSRRCARCGVRLRPLRLFECATLRVGHLRGCMEKLNKSLCSAVKTILTRRIRPHRATRVTRHPPRREVSLLLDGFGADCRRPLLSVSCSQSSQSPAS